MGILKDFYFVFVFFSGILGIVVGLVLTFFNRTFSYSSKLLAGYLICFSLLALNYTLITKGFFQRFPHLWRLVGWASFSFAPLGYMYVRSVLNQEFRLRKPDLLWFIPAVLYPISLIPFFLKPASEKIAFLKLLAANPRMITEEPETLYPNGFTFILRIAVGIAAVSAQYWVLVKWRKQNQTVLTQASQNRKTFRWLSLFSGIQVVFWTIIIIHYFIYIDTFAPLNYPILLTISGTILFVCLYLLTQPEILYGIKGWNVDVVAVVDLLKDDERKEKKRYILTVEQGAAYKKLLEEYLMEHKPFLDSDFSLANLSHQLKIPAYRLSSFINQEYAQNFNELINTYRVNHLMSTLIDSKSSENFTLEALGKEVGFNSRAAFISAVKKNTGKTPSEIFGRRQNKESQ